jgi:hypothetical protein
MDQMAVQSNIYSALFPGTCISFSSTEPVCCSEFYLQHGLSSSFSETHINGTNSQQHDQQSHDVRP